MEEAARDGEALTEEAPEKGISTALACDREAEPRLVWTIHSMRQHWSNPVGDATFLSNSARVSTQNGIGEGKNLTH
jgi:hypothetical protein